jgi:hypothetical protein
MFGNCKEGFRSRTPGFGKNLYSLWFNILGIREILRIRTIYDRKHANIIKGIRIVSPRFSKYL